MYERERERERDAVNILNTHFVVLLAYEDRR